MAEWIVNGAPSRKIYGRSISAVSASTTIRAISWLVRRAVELYEHHVQTAPGRRQARTEGRCAASAARRRSMRPLKARARSPMVRRGGWEQPESVCAQGRRACRQAKALRYAGRRLLDSSVTGGGAPERCGTGVAGDQAIDPTWIPRIVGRVSALAALQRLTVVSGTRTKPVRQLIYAPALCNARGRHRMRPPPCQAEVAPDQLFRHSAARSAAMTADGCARSKAIFAAERSSVPDRRRRPAAPDRLRQHHLPSQESARVLASVRIGVDISNACPFPPPATRQRHCSGAASALAVRRGFVSELGWTHPDGILWRSCRRLLRAAGEARHRDVGYCSAIDFPRRGENYLYWVKRHYARLRP